MIPPKERSLAACALIVVALLSWSAPTFAKDPSCPPGYSVSRIEFSGKKKIIHCARPLPPDSPPGAKDARLREIRSHVAETARSFIGSGEWDYRTAHCTLGENTYKCNEFVADVANLAGALVPMIRGRHYQYPPLAQDWGNPSVRIPGWTIAKDPKPGDLAAEPHPYSDATGHCGIVTGDHRTTSANAKLHGRITENDWGFRPDDHPVFRRYTGE